ncbi:MAG: hypothetical protein MI741_14490 [Rhodospirillales bacterium]|nr:hypothetical protein [Rhodospirillales bacterium]
MSLCLGIGAFGLLTALVEGPHPSRWYERDHGEVWKEMIYLDRIHTWTPELSGRLCVAWRSETIKDLALASRNRNSQSFHTQYNVWPEGENRRGIAWTDGQPIDWRFGSPSRAEGFVEVKVGKPDSPLCAKLRRS